MDPEKVKNYLNSRDRFARLCGISITRAEPGYAEAELVVREAVLNGLDHVQGGALMTLADLAFAAAANSTGESMVTLNCTMNFIRPGGGKLLTAKAVIDHAGRKTVVGSIRVTNEEGTLIASMTATGFVVGGELPFPGAKS